MHLMVGIVYNDINYIIAAPYYTKGIWSLTAHILCMVFMRNKGGGRGPKTSCRLKMATKFWAVGRTVAQRPRPAEGRAGGWVREGSPCRMGVLGMNPEKVL
jgi:hypothetical protein